MKRFCFILPALLLGTAGWSLPGTAAGQTHDHTQAQHGAAAANAPPCHTAPQITEAAELKPGGALYAATETAQHADHSGHEHQTTSQMAGMEGAHTVHDPQRGGTFFMAPNKTHHVEAVYSAACGFQLFLYNAFTQPISVERFQAFVHVFPESDDEFDIIRFLSPTNSGSVLAAGFGDAVSRPFKVELYVKFPESDEPQLFNIAVAEAEEVVPSDIMVSQPWARPIMSGRPAAAYLTMANNGAGADRLLAASSPAFKSVELHLTRKEGTMTTMYPVETINLAANQTVELGPGGFHVMLFGARNKFRQDDSFPLVLTFEKAGQIEVEVQITP